MKFDISPSGIPLSCQYHSMCACYTIHRHEVHVGRSNGVVYITKLVCKVFLSNAHFHWSPLPDSHNSINSGLHKSLHMNIQTQNFHQPRTFQQIFEHVPNFGCVYKPTRSHTYTHTPIALIIVLHFRKGLCTGSLDNMGVQYETVSMYRWYQWEKHLSPMLQHTNMKTNIEPTNWSYIG